MPKFRKKPVVIEAIQNLDNPSDVAAFFGSPRGSRFGHRDGVWSIGTLEGTMDARRGDWIIRGIKGEYYPCKPDIFEATYEPVEPCSCPGCPHGADPELEEAIREMQEG